MPGRWGEAPFIALSAALATGIWLGQWPIACSFGWAAAGCLAIIAAAWSAFRAGRLSCSMWLAFGSVALCGALLAIARRDGYPDRDVRALLAHGTLPLHEPVGFDACVAEERSRDADDVILRVDLRALRLGERWQASHGGALVRIPAERGPDRFPRYGDRIRGWALFDLRRDYANPGSADRREALVRRGVFVVGRVKSARLLERVPGDCGGWWDTAAFLVRSRLEARFASLADRGATRESAILASLLVGNYSELDGETREAFQNSGTFHVLVVSGMHVGWLAWALLLLLRLLRCPEVARRLAVAGGILFYTSVVGFQASISRSFWMFFLYVLGQALSRRSSPVNVAGASAFTLLSANPDWLFDAGFQLSFLSVMAICLLGAPVVDNALRPLFDPLLSPHFERRRKFRVTAAARLGRRLETRCALLAEAGGDRIGPKMEPTLRAMFRWGAAGAFTLSAMLAISLSVQVWIEPTLAYRYNRLSWIAPFANLAIVPLSSLVLSAGVVAIVMAGIPHLAGPSLALAESAAALLFRVTSATASVGFGWQRCPTAAWSSVAVALLILAAWCFLQRRRVWIACAGTVALLGALGSGHAPRWMKPRDLADRIRAFRPGGPPLLSLTFLDVGQGDCTVLRFPDGRVWVVDAGGTRQEPSAAGAAFDVGEAVVSRYLWHGWIPSLDRVLVTHPHQDHAGGVPALLRNFPVGALECGAPDPLLSTAFAAAAARGTPVAMARPEEERHFGRATVTTLCPPAGLERAAANEGSVVLRVTYGRFAALLTGDMERSEESYLVRRPGPIEAVLLKVAHHGSRYATLNPMLERVRPRWAVISAGRNNPFGAPARDLLMRLLRHGARPLLTMDEGAISLVTDGEDYVLSSHVEGVLESGRLPPR